MPDTSFQIAQHVSNELIARNIRHYWLVTSRINPNCLPDGCTCSYPVPSVLIALGGCALLFSVFMDVNFAERSIR